MLSFDLMEYESGAEEYDIKIYSSLDGYRKPLKVINGKVKGVNPGGSQLITLDGKRVFAGFKGELDFKVVADLTYSPIKFNSALSKSVKIGKSIEASWNGGNGKEKYALEYSDDGKDWHTISNNIETQYYLWKIPKNSSKGIYNLRLSASNNPSGFVYSDDIRVKKGMPLWSKILIGAVVAGGTYFVIDQLGGNDSGMINTGETGDGSGGDNGGDSGGGSGNGNDGTTNPSNLPDPPTPPQRANGLRFTF